MGILKWLIKRILIVLIILGALVFLFQKQLLKILVPYAVKKVTNTGMKIDEVESRIQKGYLKLQDVILLNPRGFKEPNLAKINFILVEADLMPILKGEFALRKLFIDIEKIYIIRQEKEGINIVEIRKEPEKAYRGKEKKKFSIQDLRIRISEVIYKDFRTQPPKMTRIHLGFEQKYTNITDISEVINSILIQNVLKATLSNLISGSGLKRGLGSNFDRIFDIFQ